LRGLEEPVLLDEWHAVPSVLGAVRRAVERAPTPNRYLLTGSVRAELDVEVWPATGRIVQVPMHPMTVREQRGLAGGQTFFDRIADGEELVVPDDTPDLSGYVDLALRSGFPSAALALTGRPRRAWLESYIDNLLTHDVETLERSPTRRRDTARLRRYFEAYAINSAGHADHKTIVDAAGINRITARAYDRLLEDLLIVDELPSWSTNRLKRLVKGPKRYVVEPALIAAVLRVDTRGTLRDGDLLGRILDTFVAAQLRPEAVASRSGPRLYHVRTESGRREIDIVAELTGERVIAIEVKADAAPQKAAAAHLRWLRDELEAGFVLGVVLHTGPRVYELDDRIVAAPISSIWGRPDARRY
jgi:predicted AAA+ superfamily ATPase